MIDWGTVEQQAAKLLSEYLRIPTINPPGDTTAAVDFLKRQLRERGISSETFVSNPGRINLLARLPGNGQKKSILLYNHMDVVEVDEQRWTKDPFSGEIEDGYVYGRGAIDMKGMGIMQLLAMDLLQKNQPERSRDILFFAAPDEETGGEFGTRWMVNNHWEQLDPEFVWDEGGFGLVEMFGPSPVFTVALAEKKTLWLKFQANGAPGQSGMPHDDNAVNILMNALQRVLKAGSKWEVTPLTNIMFRKIAETMPFPRSFLLSNLQKPLIFNIVKTQLTSEKTIAAMLKNTISVTSFHAGDKENIIPETAEATLDIRLLPNTDPERFLADIRKLVKDERIIMSVILAPEQASVSDMDVDFYRSLEKVLLRRTPGSITAPMLTPGTTDSCFFRQKGVNCYGLFPAIINPGELSRFHGNDERISIKNLVLGVQIIYDVLKDLTS